MAIVAPIVLLFALAACDFGRVVHHYTVVSNAARAGAEYGGMHSFTPFIRAAWEADIKSAINDEMRGIATFDSTKLDVVIDTTTDADGLFRVAVRTTYPFTTAVAWPGLPAVTSLSHRVEMRQIQ